MAPYAETQSKSAQRKGARCKLSIRSILRWVAITLAALWAVFVLMLVAMR
jgi:hypothetical protein